MPEVWNIGGQDPYTAMQVGMENARKNRLADMDLAQKIQAEAQNKALNELMKTYVDPVTGKIDVNRLAGGLATGGYGRAVPGLLKEYAGLREAQGKADEQSGKAVTETMKMFRDLLPSDPAKAASWARAAHNNPVLAPYLSQIGSVEDTIAKIPTDPAEYAKWYNQMGLSVDDAIKRSTMTAAEAAAKATAERNAATAEGQLAASQGNLAVSQARERREAAKETDRSKVAYQQVSADGTVTNFNQFGEVIRTQTGAGKPSATYEKTKATEKRMGQDMSFALSQLKEITKDGGLIDQSTGSGAGRAVDVTAGFFGKATPGAVAIGKLKPISDLVLKLVPRFEGPQSDADTQSYKEAAGQLADPTLPTEIRKEAGKTIIRLMTARQGQFGYADQDGAIAAGDGVDTNNPLLK